VAGPLKEAAQAIFGWDESLIEDPEKKEQIDPKWGVSPRVAMQYLGHEFLKDLGEVNPAFAEKTGTNLYVIRMAQFFERNQASNIVVTDVRFPAEVEAIHKAGGIVIRVDRPSITKNFIDQHASESFYDDLEVDEDVKNDATLEILFDRIHNIYKRHKVLGF
jgi:hypothetical protein